MRRTLSSISFLLWTCAVVSVNFAVVFVNFTALWSYLLPVIIILIILVVVVVVTVVVGAAGTATSNTCRRVFCVVIALYKLVPSSTSHQSAVENRRSVLKAGIQALLKDRHSPLAVRRPNVRPSRGKHISQPRKRGVLINRRLPVSLCCLLFSISTFLFLSD